MFDFVGVYVEAWHKVLTPSLPPFSFLVNQGSEHRRVSAHAVMRLEPVGSNLFCGYVFP
ncbi:MAG: hypothetical protein M5U14_04915 [Acidimicrobiia bacterium]|nr:hypothetical protein [Acidimicrobiia bacterium]